MKATLFDVALYEEYLDSKVGLSSSSAYVYVSAVRLFLEPNPDISSLEAYNEFLLQKTVRKSCYNYYFALKHFVEYKFSDGEEGNDKIKSMLLSGLMHSKLKDPTKSTRPLRPVERLSVINELLLPKHQVMSMIMEVTGVRAGDILRLRMGNIKEDVYQKKRVIRFDFIGKGGRRVVKFVFDPVVQGVVRSYLAGDGSFKNLKLVEGYVFLEQLKRKRKRPAREFQFMRCNYTQFLNDLQNALTKNKIAVGDFATHDFRRCFARRVWDKYKDMFVLQTALGHRRIETSARYLRTSGMATIDVANAMQEEGFGQDEVEDKTRTKRIPTTPYTEDAEDEMTDISLDIEDPTPPPLAEEPKKDILRGSLPPVQEKEEPEDDSLLP